LKIEILKIGKPNFPEIKSLVETYRERLTPLTRIESIEMRDPVDPKSPKSQKAGEGFKVPARSPDEIWIALDEFGKEWSSKELATKIQGWRDDPRVKVVRFVIGGPYGLPAPVRARADAVWSLSRATFPSDIAWLLCWEQVFRAFAIINKTGYHHE
jgi:23S rRNA (pseudouridine1915-N3)-methyltransferase